MSKPKFPWGSLRGLAVIAFIGMTLAAMFTGNPVVLLVLAVMTAAFSGVLAFVISVIGVSVVVAKTKPFRQDFTAWWRGHR